MGGGWGGGHLVNRHTCVWAGEASGWGEEAGEAWARTFQKARQCPAKPLLQLTSAIASPWPPPANPIVCTCQDLADAITQMHVKGRYEEMLHAPSPSPGASLFVCRPPCVLQNVTGTPRCPCTYRAILNLVPGSSTPYSTPLPMLSQDVADAIAQMHVKGRYKELLLIVETCQAATLYSKIQ